MLQRTVANEASVEEQILQPIVAATVSGIRHETMQTNLVAVVVSVRAVNFDETIGQLLSKQNGDTVTRLLDRRQIVHQTTTMMKREMNLRVCQSEPRDRLGNVAHLGLGGPQKFMPHGGIEKQLPHLNGSALPTTNRTDRFSPATHYF